MSSASTTPPGLSSKVQAPPSSGPSATSASSQSNPVSVVLPVSLPQQPQQPFTGPPIITKAPLGMDDVQPVDLVAVKKYPISAPTHLKIPVIPSRPTFRPQPHLQSIRPSTSLTIPKPNPVMQVVQPSHSKVALHQTSSMTKSGPGMSGSHMPLQVLTSPGAASTRMSTASTILRGLSPVPTFIRSPSSGGLTHGVRLSGPQGNSSPYGPVSVAQNTMRTMGSMSVRPSPVSSRPDPGTGPVRVTIVQQPQSGGKIVHPLPLAGQTTTLFKPLNLSSQSSPTSVATNSGTVRISTFSNPRMTIIPTTALNMNMGTHVNPMTLATHNLLPGKPIFQQSNMPPRLPGNVSVPVVSTGGGVTIHKTTLGMGDSSSMTIPKTVSLPLGPPTAIVPPNHTGLVTIATSLPTIRPNATHMSQTMNAIPVARVSSNSLTGYNTTNLMAIATTGASSHEGGIFITRSSPSQPMQQIAFNLSATPNPQYLNSPNNKIRSAQPMPQLAAINLSTSSGAHFQSNTHKLRPMNVSNFHKMNMPSYPARLMTFPQPAIASVSGLSTAEKLVSMNDLHRPPVNLVRPGILRGREGEREHSRPDTPVSPIPMSDSIGTSNSAVSSPDIQPVDLICNEELHSPSKISALNGCNVEPSPRKKPRKQQLGNVREPNWNENDDPLMPKDLKRKVPLPRAEPNFDEQLLHDELKNGDDDNESDCGKQRPVLMDDNRYLWNCRITHHFAHETEVRSRDERKPTVNDLANQKGVFQKIEGWKVLYLTSQMVDIIDDEHDLTQKLEEFQKRLHKAAHPDISGKELVKVEELIKANLQRGRVIQDQIGEAKGSILEIFDYKPKVVSIIRKYECKRSLKQRNDV